MRPALGDVGTALSGEIENQTHPYSAAKRSWAQGPNGMKAYTNTVAVMLHVPTVVTPKWVGR